MSERFLRLNLTVLSIAVLFCAAGTNARAQHEQHDMSNMPGMSKPQPKRKPQAKPAPKRKTTAPHKHDMTDAEMKQMAQPAPAASPESSETTATAPEASPAPADANLPGMQQPAPATTPMPENMQMPAANPSGEPQQPAISHDSMPGMTDESMPGMVHNGVAEKVDIPTTDSLDLMVMSGREMGIRVGASAKNMLSMSQMGSGTSWQPGTSPMSMLFKYARGWLLFLHGEAKVGINSQGGPRGVTKLESQNWLMPMAFRRIGHGTLQLRGMFSLEPFTFSPGGSPQLFQTGESYKGQPLVDRQHPHDLFMELSANYTMPIGERSTWFAYVGFPGEPALGPTAFMHRPSASENLSAPLAHHLQDSTHISFGVITTGFTYRWFKLEGSLFNGREPDENRYNFEFNPWNSRSVRLSFAPTSNWSMQVSHGFLKNPEVLEPGDIRRTTASIAYNKNFAGGNWASSLIWGRNHGSHEGEPYNINSYTAESTLNFRNLNYVYTRLELVDKNELLRGGESAALGLADSNPTFRIGAYTVGYVRDVLKQENFTVGVGGDATFYSKPKILDGLYGENPVSYKFFLRFRLGGTMGGAHDNSMHDGMSGMSGNNPNQPSQP